MYGTVETLCEESSAKTTNFVTSGMIDSMVAFVFLLSHAGYDTVLYCTVL